MFRSRWRRWTLRWLWNMVRPWPFVFVSLMEKSCVSFLGISWNCYTFVDANWSKSLHSYCGCAVCYSSGSQESHLQIYGAKTTARGRCQAHQLVRHEKSIGWDFGYAFFPNLLPLKEICVEDISSGLQWRKIWRWQKKAEGVSPNNLLLL